MPLHELVVEVQHACCSTPINFPDRLKHRNTAITSATMQVEVHMLHEYGDDFHGFAVRVMVTGFIRPELKFESLTDLVDRIHRDISIARVQLEHEWSMSWKDDELFM